MIRLISAIFLLATLSPAVGVGADQSVSQAAMLAEAQALGAPMEAVRQALFTEARTGLYENRDFVSVFDVSQPSNLKRFYLFDLRAGRVTSYYASHGRGNGSAARATVFRGFNDPDRNMTPLGALITGQRTIVGDAAHLHKSMLGLEGTKPYNSAINTKGAWTVFHTKDYATASHRRQNGGTMGRSNGCIVLDPYGEPLDAPLDTTTNVAFACYANRNLAAQMIPIVREEVRRHLG